MGPKGVRISTPAALLVAMVAMVATLTTPPAGAATGCSFGGPTPGWRAIKVVLTQPSSFLTLELSGLRTVRLGQTEANWHLAQGIFVINSGTLELEAYRVSSSGMVARSAVVRVEGGEYVHESVPGVDIPYSHSASRLRDGLPTGSYYVVAFGTDGTRALPNEWWSAGVQIDGQHSCAPIGSGEVFDYDLTDFRGGTQVYAQGVGVADGTTFSFDTARSLVVGLMDAESQARTASSTSLDYATPTGGGSLSQQIVPFVSTSGSYAYEASYAGFYPLIAIAGVTLDIP